MSEAQVSHRSGPPAKVIDRVYLSIKRMVIEFEILPGQQIHIEELANHLNVSVTPVREALNQLLNEGFIHRQVGRGFQNRSIEREELTDLFQLRGSLAISAFHFILNTDLRGCIPEILDNAHRATPLDKTTHIPICWTLLQAVNNREILRIYENITDKLHYIWDIYSKSPGGRRHIEEYSRRIEETLIEGNLPACISVIDANIRFQLAALDEVIPEALARLLAWRSSPTREFDLSRPASVPRLVT